jgi:signal transduction histidine kinase
MASDVERNSPPARTAEVLARILRHEVGDLLQSIYATVAVLMDRLPGERELERRLLSDLKGRAEGCKQELDAVVDLICPVTLTRAPFDLANLATTTLASCTRRFPSLAVTLESPEPVLVEGDARRLGQVGSLLLLSLCQLAQGQVRVRVTPSAGAVEWAFASDGFGATEEQLGWLTRPFSSTRHAQLGVALALARRVLELHGGRALAENPAAGGCSVRLVLPCASLTGESARAGDDERTTRESHVSR